jgi:hypothetical protein
MTSHPIEMTRVPAGQAWLADETAWVWRTAQAEAARAFGAWCREPGAAGYAVYRAAQDRADAAQDVLARRAVSGQELDTAPVHR